MGEWTPGNSMALAVLLLALALAELIAILPRW